MAITCWIRNCHHNNMRETCKFFRFPKDRKQWLRWTRLIRRDALPGSGARVCSCHFRDGKKENGPEMLPHNVEKAFQPHYLTPEKQTKRRKVERPHPVEQATTSATKELFPGDVSEISAEVPTVEPFPTSQEVGTQTSLADIPSTSVAGKPSTAVLEAEIDLLKQELAKKDAIIKTLKLHFSYSHISGKDHLVLLYTGLPRAAVFESLCNLISRIEINYHLKWKIKKLSIEDQLLLTLMKLRQNFPHMDLALRFQISQTTVTNIIITFVDVLKRVLHDQLMAKIPSRQKNLSCLPSCCSTFTNCRIIVDAMKIFSAVPRQSMKKQKLTYSSYKHRNTWKAIVGCGSNGVITFASGLYAGSSSDKTVVQNCGLLEQLVPGDLIVADKSFLLSDILPAGVSLNIPPFIQTPKFTPEQVRRTQCIARARILIERAIRRIKCYKILTYIPQNLFICSSNIFKVVVGLTNLQYPLIREVEQFYELEI